jgi:hypothetical protein
LRLKRELCLPACSIFIGAPEANAAGVQIRTRSLLRHLKMITWRDGAMHRVLVPLACERRGLGHAIPWRE